MKQRVFISGVVGLTHGNTGKQQWNKLDTWYNPSWKKHFHRWYNVTMGSEAGKTIYIDPTLNGLVPSDIRIHWGERKTDAEWFQETRGEPQWKDGRLQVPIAHIAQFASGIYQDGTIGGTYHVKQRALDDIWENDGIDLPDGISDGTRVFYIPSQRKYKGKYWAKMISLRDPQWLKTPDVNILFRLGDTTLSLEDALRVSLMVNRMKDTMGVDIDTETNPGESSVPWVFSRVKDIVVREFDRHVNIFPNLHPRSGPHRIKDFRHFLWVYKRSVERVTRVPRGRHILPHLATYEAPGVGKDGRLEQETFRMLRRLYKYGDAIWSGIDGAIVKDLLRLNEKVSSVTVQSPDTNNTD